MEDEQKTLYSVIWDCRYDWTETDAVFDDYRDALLYAISQHFIEGEFRKFPYNKSIPTKTELESKTNEQLKEMLSDLNDKVESWDGEKLSTFKISWSKMGDKALLEEKMNKLEEKKKQSMDEWKPILDSGKTEEEIVREWRHWW